MKSWIIWTAFGVALLALVAWRFSAMGEQEGQLKQQQGQRRGAGANVEVAEVVKGAIQGSLQAVGTVESPHKVLISAKFSGRIEYLEAREGDSVAPGQVLVTLDESEIQGQVLQQKANLAEARSRLAQARINLAPTTAGVSSQIAQAQAALESAIADREQVEQNFDAQVAAAKARVTDAENRVNAALSQQRNAEASLDRDKASLVNAQARYDRAASLHQKGFISAQALDDAKTLLDSEKAEVRVAEGMVAAATSAVGSARAVLSSEREQAAIVERKSRADITAAKARVKQAQSALTMAEANRAVEPAYRENIAALTADVSAAEAQVRQAESRLSDMQLRSPIQGTVTARRSEVGAMATPGQTLLEVQLLDWVYVTASIPVESSSEVREGAVAEVVFDALPGQTFRGPITNVNRVADPQTRQFSIRIRLENPGQTIRPGMFGKVALKTGEPISGALVPREALVQTPSGMSVTVVDADGTAHVRTVKVGASDGSRVQILEGVKPGERVVTLSYSPVREGAKVTIGGAGQPSPDERGSAKPQPGGESKASGGGRP